jgi:protein SCO1
MNDLLLIGRKKIMKTRLFIIVLISLFIYILSAFSEETKPEIGIDERLGEKIPLDLKFYNSNGDTLSLGQIFDRPIVLSLVYYHCPGICSPLLTNLSETLNQIKLIPGQDFKVITISFDPNETPETAAKWKKNYLDGMTRKDMKPSAWYFMTGDSSNINRLTDAIGFHFKSDGKKDFIHAGSIYVIAKDGKISRYLFGTDFLAVDLKMAIIEARKEISTPTINKILDMCYSYDPAGHKLKLSFTRIIGSVMVFGTVIFLSVLIIKKKKHSSDNENDNL